MYDELIALLEAIDGIQFCEYEWATRPAGNHGTYRIDFDASTDSGDDHSQDRAIEGQALRLMEKIQEQIDGIEVKEQLLNDIEELHNRN